MKAHIGTNADPDQRGRTTVVPYHWCEDGIPPSGDLVWHIDTDGRFLLASTEPHAWAIAYVGTNTAPVDQLEWFRDGITGHGFEGDHAIVLCPLECGGRLNVTESHDPTRDYRWEAPKVATCLRCEQEWHVLNV